MFNLINSGKSGIRQIEINRIIKLTDTKMKAKNGLLSVAIAALSLLTCNLYGQDSNVTVNREGDMSDSTEAAMQKDMHEQQIKDDNTMADFRHDRKRTKAKAKEAQRIQNEANAAARESKYALKSERRAQKARKDANRQAEKASDARNKSDRN